MYGKVCWRSCWTNQSGERSNYFLKINSYSDSPAITDSEYQNRLNSIKNSLEERDLDEKFNDYVLNIMANKKVEFNEKHFLLLLILLRQFI